MSTLLKEYRKWFIVPVTVLMLCIGFSQAASAQINFTISTLSGASTLAAPTTMQFGPDGKLYVGTESGKLFAYTVAQTGPNAYTVTSTQNIPLVSQIPNHNDDAVLYTAASDTRQVTGLLVTGTAANPVIYVSSSDPRVGGGGSMGDLNLDTNSGIVSRLTWNGSSWDKVDLVRGLPRSEENHAVNGLHLDKTTNILYLAIGGHTNTGSPSNNFAYLNEYALSAAILSIDLNIINTLPIRGVGNVKYLYDLPTLDDPTRPNVSNPDYNPSIPGSQQTIDQGDPFGGNDGRNQAKLVPGGPVQIYASGYRNAYDILVTKTPGKTGRMYTIDNGANGGWGGYPKNTNTPGITNEYLVGEPGSTTNLGDLPMVTNKDNMHLVSKPGMAPVYGGHPNPIRANPGGAGLYYYDGITATFSLSPTSDWPPVPLSMANPAEANALIHGVNDGALTTFSTSTNGIAEYTSSNYFGGQMVGDILTADFSGIIWRMKMSEDGTQVASKEIFASGFGEITLDIIAQGTGDIFEGTVWSCDYTASKIYIFTPQGSVNCSGNNASYTLDDDEDGFSNADERDNGTNACNASSFPADFDGDHVSNLNDSDDDNDGINDLADKFHRDASNGQNTASTLLYPFLNGNPGTGLFGMGLTGLMSDGTTNPDSKYDMNDPGLIMGGAVGLASFPAGAGNPMTNTLKYGFQYGYKVNSSSQPFSVQTSLIGPFFNNLTATQITASHRQGIYIGKGDQDNYLMLAVSGNGSNSGLRVVMENNGTVMLDNFYPVSGILNASAIFLYLDVNPATGVVTPKYSTSTNTTIQAVGSPVTLVGQSLTTLQGPDALAVGIIAYGNTTTYSAKWDYLNIMTNAPAVATPIADIQTTVNASNQNFDLSNVFTDDEGGNNITLSVSGNSNPGLVTASMSGKVITLAFAPELIGNSTIKIKATDSDGFFVEETFVITVIPPPPTTSILINAGGSLETFGSETWVEDQYYTGGAAYTEVNPIENTTKDALYQSERWGDFSYHIPVPNGTYTVKLHFADFYHTVAGARKFNVNVESGQALLTNYDIVAKAGGGKKAVVETLNNISIVDGVLDMNFVSLVDNAKLSAIEIISVSGGGVNVPPVVSNEVPNQLVEVNTPSITLSLAKIFTDNNGPSNLTITVSGNTNPSLVTSAAITNNLVKLSFAGGQTGIANIKVKATDGGGLFVEDEFKVEVLSSMAAPTTVVRIKSGGPAVTFEGKTWIADQYFTSGSSYGTGQSISGTNNDELYQTERSESFTYAVPVPNGTYGVKLHFAEIFWQEAGKRQFNVNVENNQGALFNYDVFATAGGAYKAVIEQFNNVQVTDGVMNLSFAKVIDNAKVSAIEIFSQPGAVNTEPDVANLILTQTFNKNSGVNKVPLKHVFTDNGGANNLTLSVSGNTNTALISNAVILNDTLYLTVAPEAIGISMIKIKATDQQGLFTENEFQVNVQIKPVLTSLKIAAGGLGFTYKGQTWGADDYFSGGWIYSDTEATIAGTQNQRLYQFERNGNLFYKIPVVNGTYTVKLHFTDLYWTLPGQRVFKLDIENGRHVYNNFDVIAKAGAPRKAYVEVLDTLLIKDGFFDLTMSEIVDNARISGIEIIPYNNGINAAPELITPIPDQQAVVNSPVRKIPIKNVFDDDKGVVDLYRIVTVNSNPGLLNTDIQNDSLVLIFVPGQIGTANLTIRATDGQGLFVEDQLVVEVLLTAPPSIVRINSGGPALTLGSDTWLADQYFTNGYTNTNTTEVDNTTLDQLFQSERWDNHVYNIPVSNSSYTVRLYFSENYYTLPGQRKFNVNVESGQGGLVNYDILAKAGAMNKAVVETFNNIVVSDGMLNLTFVNVVGNAKICGIEIVPYSATNTAPVVNNPIPDQVIQYNTASKLISLGSVFSDNGGASNITMTISGNTNTALVTSATIYGPSLTLFFGANQGGTAKIKVKATDAQGLFVEDEFNVIIEGAPIVIAPIITNPIPDQQVTVGTTSKVIQLVNVFADDKGDANMTLSVSGNTNAAMITGATISGTTLTLTFAAGVTGTANIKIKALDSDALFAEDEFVMNVVAAPLTPPVVTGSIPDQQVYLGTTTKVISLASVFTDEKGAAQITLTVSGNTNTPMVTGAVISGTNLTLTFAPGVIGTANIKIKATDSDALFAEDEFKMDVVPVPATQIRIAAGGPGHVFETETWSADQHFTGGNAYGEATAIANTTNDLLYHNERWGDASYSIPVPNGAYSVKLHFAEIFFTTTGSRVFNVNVENGQGLLTNYDIVAKAGAGKTAVVEQFANINVTDGNMTITLAGVTDNAKISGIEIISVAASNAAPAIIAPIADQQIASGTTSKLISLANVFTDNGGAANLVLTVSGNSNTNLVPTAVISGGSLTLNFGSGITGTSVIKIKATDAQGLFIEDEFNVTVAVANTAPVVSVPIPDQPITLGTTSKLIALANVFTDNGGAANLTLTVSGNTNTALVTNAVISATNLTLTLGAGVTGTSTIKVKATDAQGLFVEDTFIVTISAGNTAPIISLPIPDQEIISGTIAKVISLAGVFNDDAGAAALKYTVSSNSNNTIITSALISGTNLTIRAAAAKSGPVTLKIKAADVKGLFIEDEFVVNVLANVKPVISTPIPDYTVPVGTPNLVINLANHFTDDHGAANISYLMAQNTNTAVVSSAVVNGTTLTLTFVPGVIGVTSIKIRTSDAQNLYVDEVFIVKTAAIANAKPAVVNPISDQPLTVGPSNHVISLANTFNDDAGAASLILTVNGNSNTSLVTSALINGTNLTLNLGSGIIGSSTIKIKATDALGLFIEDEFVLTVSAGNTAPTVANPVADQVIPSGTLSKVLSLTNLFIDNGGAGNLTLTVSGNSNTALVTGAVITSSNLTLTMGAGISGTSIIKLKATDAQGLFVEFSFNVIVSAGNTAPTVNVPIPNQQIISGTLSTVISLANAFTDDAGAAALKLTVSSNSDITMITSAIISGTNLTVRVAAAKSGPVTLKIKAADVKGLFVEDEFVVNVLANVKPVTSTPIPDYTLPVSTPPLVINLANHFTDDHGALNISYLMAQNSNTALVSSAVVNGTTLTLTFVPGVIGVSSMKIRTSDAQGLYVDEVFIVRTAVAVNLTPTIVNPIPDKQITVGASNQVINLSNVFSDDGGAASLVTTVSGNSNTALVTSTSITGGNLTLNLGSGVTGTSIVKVKATDAQGLFVEDVFNMTVSPAPVAPVVANPIPDQSVTQGTTSKVISLASVFTDEKGAANITLSVSGNTNTPLVTAATISGTNLTLNFATTLHGSALIKVKATDSDGLFVEDQFKMDVTSTTPTTLIRIAAGGPGHSFGTEVWGADQYFSGGNAYGQPLAIANTTNDQLYENERWGDQSYNIPVPNGAYTVKLHFAEIFWETPGNRVFNVNVENGQGLLTNYDIVAKAGAGATAVVEQFATINVADGILSITLASVTDNAKISGIEVISHATSGGGSRIARGATLDAKASNESVELNWTTGDQTEGEYTIERSADGKQFQTLTTTLVTSTDRKNLVRRYADLYPFNGTSYYRLKRAGTRGTPATYSTVREVNFAKNNHSFLVYPNPNNTGILFLEFPKELGTQENIKIRVLSMTGAMVYQQTQAERAGLLLKLNLPRSMMNGTYIVEIEKNGKRHHSRFILNR